MFPSLVPGISSNRRGVLPGDFFIVITELLGLFFSVHFTARSKTLSIWPCFSQSGSKDGDLLGIFMYSIRVGTILLSQNSVMLLFNKLDFILF